MTRDEAIADAEMAIKFVGGPGARSIEARQFVDMAVALGILKLDEPKKSAEEKFTSEMRRVGYHPDSMAMVDVRTALDAAGLRIVEK